MTEGERAVIFGRSAQTYDLARPFYPEQAIDHILARAAVQVAVEVGAGTGKATSGFAREGLEITAVEPDPAMAEMLRGRGLIGVEVVEASFESWPGPARPVDLVYAAQAWHWINHSTGYDRARQMLRPRGVLALMWNILQRRYEPFEDIYDELAPEILAESDMRIRLRDEGRRLGDLEAAGFRSSRSFTYEWWDDLTARELRRLYSTFSDHILVPESRRYRLLSNLEEKVEEMGGWITLEYETRVFSGVA